MRSSNPVAWRIAVVLTAAAMAAALALALGRWHGARRAEDHLDLARHRRDETRNDVQAWDAKVRAAERRAAEAEADTAGLLQAVAAVRRIQTIDAPPRRGGRDDSAGEARGTSAHANAAIPRSDGPAGQTLPNQQDPAARRTDAAAGRVTAMVQAAPASEEQQERLAHERRYQQELARRRAEEAKARAALDVAMATLGDAGKFALLMERAEQLAAAAEFNRAIRHFNEAMSLKPADLPLPEDIRSLQRTLQAQNGHVEVTLVSDGQTYVSIRNARMPEKVTTRTIQVLPGNYEVIGRRAGYRDVVTMVAVRKDAPPPVVAVSCTVPE